MNARAHTLVMLFLGSVCSQYTKSQHILVMLPQAGGGVSKEPTAESLIANPLRQPWWHRHYAPFTRAGPVLLWLPQLFILNMWHLDKLQALKLPSKTNHFKTDCSNSQCSCIFALDHYGGFRFHPIQNHDWHDMRFEKKCFIIQEMQITPQ